jgi:hypothetical protein
MSRVAVDWNRPFLLLPSVTSHSLLSATARLAAAGFAVLHSAVGESIADSLCRQVATLLASAQPAESVLLSCGSDREPRLLEVSRCTVIVVGDCRTAHAFVNEALHCSSANLRKKRESSAEGPAQSSVVWRPALRTSGRTLPESKLLVEVCIAREIQLFRLAEEFASRVTESLAFSRSPSAGLCSTNSGGASEPSMAAALARADCVLRSSTASAENGELLRRHVLLEVAHRSASPLSGSPGRASSPRGPSHQAGVAARLLLARLHSHVSGHSIAAENVDEIVGQICRELHFLRPLLAASSDSEEWRDDVRQHLRELEGFLADAELVASGAGPADFL